MEALLERLAPFRDRQFIFVGDYIDRGPNSRKVVDRLLELQQEVDCIFLRGNHEQMLLDALNSGNRSLWIMNGGRTTLDSYDITDLSSGFPEDHLSFYENTRLYYNTEDYFFVHAGVSPAKTIEESIDNNSAAQEFLWERSHLNAIETAWEKKVVFGHTPRPRPLKKDRMIGIDTGCVFKKRGLGKLTAVKLPEEEFIQQECLDL